LDADVTFSHQDDPAFCLEEKGETLNDEDAEEDGYEDRPNESIPEDLTLWMPSYIGASSLKEAGLEDLVKKEIQLHIGQANNSLDSEIPEICMIQEDLSQVEIALKIVTKVVERMDNGQ